jgi:hypothetical protein
MKAEEFAKALAEYMPSVAELRDEGLGIEEIEDYQGAWRCVRRCVSDVSEPAPKENEVDRLLRIYDCSTVEVCGIRFNSPLVDNHSSGQAVAALEADPIVIIRSGDVAIFDHEEPSFRIAEVAAGPESFLRLLIAATEVVDDLERWKGHGAEAVQHCAREAGGSRYEGFCSNLVLGLL